MADTASESPRPRLDTAHGWKESAKPASLFQRFEFDSYALTRAFLDRVAAISEAQQLAPQNISFGTRYVNITIGASAAELSTIDWQLALAIEQAVQA